MLFNWIVLYTVQYVRSYICIKNVEKHSLCTWILNLLLRAYLSPCYTCEMLCLCKNVPAKLPTTGWVPRYTLGTEYEVICPEMSALQLCSLGHFPALKSHI
jgi:hypothetical protein